MSLGALLNKLDYVGSNFATPDQKEFLSTLTDDLIPHVSKPIFNHESILRNNLITQEKILGRALNKEELNEAIEEVALKHLPVKKTLAEIRENVRQELKRSGEKDSEYHQALTTALAIIRPGNFDQLPALNDTNSYHKKADEVYKKTQQYGQVIVPLQQGHDFRMGASQGECYGYVATWAHALLNNQRPFGIDSQTTLFKPISADSDFLKKFPDANHLVPLNAKITQLQYGQAFKSVLDAWELESKTEQDTAVFFDPFEIAEKLIEHANKDPSNVYLLVMGKDKTGHALGFMKDEKDNFHFFDSNFGWFKFATEDNFREWFCAFHDMTFYRYFTEYYIESFQKLNPNNEKNLEQETPLQFILKSLIDFFIHNQLTQKYTWINSAVQHIKSFFQNINSWVQNLFAGPKPETNPSPSLNNPDTNSLKPQPAASYKQMLHAFSDSHTVICKPNPKKEEVKIISLETTEEKRNFAALDAPKLNDKKLHPSIESASKRTLEGLDLAIKPDTQDVKTSSNWPPRPILLSTAPNK